VRDLRVEVDVPGEALWALVSYAQGEGEIRT
jgi:hypothetical protein